MLPRSPHGAWGQRCLVLARRRVSRRRGPPPSATLSARRAACVSKKLGANVVWIGGGMGQFPALTVAERKALAAAWVPAARDNGLFVIVHVGSSCQVRRVFDVCVRPHTRMHVAMRTARGRHVHTPAYVNAYRDVRAYST